MPYKDIEKRNEYARNYMSTRREKNRENYRKYRVSLRKRVIELLGGKCINCGCTELEALEINHKNGGGRKEWKEYYYQHGGEKKFHLDIINGKRSIEDLELTCRVCNSLHYLKQIKKVKSEWKITWSE